MNSSAARLLVADDDRDVLEALRLLLRGEGYQVETVTSPEGVLTAAAARDFDAALIDMNYTRDTTGGAEGLDLLNRLHQLDASLPVVVMTAWSSIEGAVESGRRAAQVIEPSVRVIPQYKPLWLRVLGAVDDVCFAIGAPHVLDLFLAGSLTALIVLVTIIISIN